MSLQQRNRDRVLTNKANYDAAVSQTQPPPTSAFYQGFRDGRHIVKTVAGDVYHGVSLSNGATAIGDKIGLSLTAGGVPQIDTMPR
ncbi:hypothetical protein NIES2135_53270 [Leptolyngbya boryana NIES-2135]|jgi:hypothetical protein|uniref:Uncharacterized protein n=1 Tax=Leptolyngbya boryana NIES-2135 TaxID=1973484 RepID=A0A1Z4JP14_LEPBY|nr:MULTISPECIES: hypothetical protein [Leptolyngbya]BAY58454.1 hypothetical protein NIES2135_53270 [Leptolyngbya boryana NIES-2135]MBD2370927.1 hypothetical protein [Leptolyngbya sp. FACHB-161]MBD2377441.1 hypothetical protein [Leptolyngbya sp. FACHB-238]MBD2401849.1 hypothetical protein [Leptolyngbya sp. FACHB-239]MBD2408367.1 hypothetical protein [Leptolyngbya sp. FACHB-402]